MDALADHRITRIQVIPLRRSYPRPIGWNAQIGPHGQHQQVHAVRIETDRGASGWGFGGAKEEALQGFVGATLDTLYHPTDGVTLAARPLDIALHDLVGVITGQPVWRLLGAQGLDDDGQPTIPVYSGAIYCEDLDPTTGRDLGVGAVLDACRAEADVGHAHFKLKIGRGCKHLPRDLGDARDIEVTRAVREAFPDAEILVDGNDGHTPETIAAYLAAVADCRLFWIEEAFVEDAAGLRRLKEAIAEHSPETLVAEAESRHGRLQDPPGFYGKWQDAHIEAVIGLGAEGLIDVLLMDVGAMGFTAWRAVLPRLRQLGIAGSPHAWSEPFKTLYAAQLGVGFGAVPIVEGVPGHVAGVDDSAYVLEDGILTLPETPGFGLRLLED